MKEIMCEMVRYEQCITDVPSDDRNLQSRPARLVAMGFRRYLGFWNREPFWVGVDRAQGECGVGCGRRG